MAYWLKDKNKVSLKGKKHNLNELFSFRVIQRNLVYVIGLAPEISNEKVIKRFKSWDIPKINI
jgi:hypothetical protein